MKISDPNLKFPARRRKHDTWVSVPTFFFNEKSGNLCQLYAGDTPDGHRAEVSLQDIQADDWYHVQDTHDFAWAMQQVAEGKYVRRQGWHKELHVYVGGGGMVKIRGDASFPERNYDTSKYDIQATDWVSYED